jgi:hypothetical protein
MVEKHEMIRLASIFGGASAYGGKGNDQFYFLASCLAQSISQIAINSIIPKQSLEATIAHSQIVLIPSSYQTVKGWFTGHNTK